MQQPSPPESLPKYLATGLPKQDTDTLRAIQTYIETLIAYQTQPVTTDELPDRADPVDDTDAFESDHGTVVKERVKCGDDSCKCTSGRPADMHGPYLYRYYRDGGKLTSEYLGKP